MPAWSLPGYDVERLLGAGSAGEVWLARERSTLETVAVRIVTVAAEADLDRVRREAVQVAAVRHPHLVRVRSVLPVDGGVALVTDFVEGGSLVALLAARGSLTPGEVVTIGAPVATALAAIHAQGRVHTRVRGTNVLLTVDGRPLLADFGLALLADRAEDAAPGEDVVALGEVLALTLDRDAPAKLRACVERAASVDPAGRPSAEELARDLRRTGRAAPVRPDGASDAGPAPRAERASPAGGTERAPPAGGTESAPAGGRAERARPSDPPRAAQSSRPSLALLVGVPIALVAAALAGRTWAASDRPAGPPPLQVLRSAAPSAPAATVDWSAVLATLDTRRDAALVNLDTAALAEVYAGGSSPMALDAAAIARLAAARARADGLRLQVESVQLVRRTPGRVTLRVVDRLPAYDVVGADGRVLERRPGRGAAAWLVDLVPAGDGWRIAAVVRA